MCWIRLRITVFTTTVRFSRSWSRLIQSFLSHRLSLRPILFLFFHLRLFTPSCLIPSSLSTKPLYNFLFLPFALHSHIPLSLTAPVVSLDRPWGFQEFEAPRFQDSQHMMVVRFLALHTDRLYLQNYFWYSFLSEAESISGPNGLCQWKIPMTLSNPRPPACSAVPQPAAPLRMAKITHDVDIRLSGIGCNTEGLTSKQTVHSNPLVLKSAK